MINESIVTVGGVTTEQEPLVDAAFEVISTSGSYTFNVTQI